MSNLPYGLLPVPYLEIADQLRPPLCSSSTHSSPLLAILHHLHHPRARRLSLLVLTGSLTTPPLHLFSDNTSHHAPRLVASAALLLNKALEPPDQLTPFALWS
ncbi:hypothetical protein FALCPG4_010659 [Fusarium falciforme]